MKLCPRCSESFADDASFCPFDASELARSSDPLIGRTLAARYRLVRPLGRGGMALVYLAKHVMIDRLSAIKVLRRDLAMSASHRERFLREARAVNRINHPNIVEITDLGESDGLVFLVMEYVEGESLIAALRRGRFPWPRAARVATQIASALARAHDVGIIHRDLKPENVLLGSRAGEELVKLTDFGIAKILDAPALTFSEQRFGTPGYIAPEYAEGAPAAAQGDLYALGVVLYEMLTGAMPFDARGAELLVAPLREAPVKPSARAEGIPAEVEELVLRLIARQPADRPRDAFAVVDALGDILRRLAGSARPPPASGEDEGRPSLVTTLGDGPAYSFRAELTAEIAALPTAEIAARWHGMVSELTKHIDLARVDRGESSGVRRARELASLATELVTSLERAKATVAEHQSRVDRLETHGRAFRGTLGHAIDSLSRDRSRERAHLDAIEARREGIDLDVTLTGIDAVAREVIVWEQAALEAEEGRAHLVEQDLRYQVEALQRQLATQNEQLDAELADATGKLEGALSALRRMTGELIRTIEEAASVVGR
ncbi:MAG TPA: serine/threonine-protein kinase [Polyangiaceae bacterium]|jgi:serine/threonine-protein kinase